MTYIDTHAHLNFKAFEKDYKDVIRRAFDKNVKSIICVGSNYKTSKRAIEIVEDVESLALVENVKGVELYAAVGLHPIHLAKDITEKCLIDGEEYKFITQKEEFNYDKYQRLIESSDKIVAVGETGLDFYRIQNAEFKMQNIKKIINLQKKVFREHIELAKKNNLPLILHCRGTKDDPYSAYDEMLEILKHYANTRMYAYPKCLRGRRANDANKNTANFTSEVKYSETSEVMNWGVIHCFVGNLRQAREFINLGFLIGVNGIITFKNAKELQDIVKKISLNKILLETDCPFLAPRPSRKMSSPAMIGTIGHGSRDVAGGADPHRGKRNEPAYIPIIAQKIAELKNINIKKVENQTTSNAEKLFGL